MHNVRLLLIALIVSADAGLQAGHSSWIPNGSRNAMRKFIKKNIMFTLTPYSLDIVWSLFVTLRIIGQVIGAEVARPIVDKRGRRFCLRLNAFCFIISNIMQLIAGETDSVALLFIGRLVQCFALGIAQISLAIFVTEISGKECRGRNAALYNVFIGFGSVLTIVAANKATLGGYDNWHTIVAFPLFTSSVNFILSWFLPESPRFLIQHNLVNISAVRASFEFYQNRKLSDDEINDLIMNTKAEGRGGCTEEPSMGGLMRSHYLRQSVILMLGVSTARALSGYSMMFSYSTFAIENTGMGTYDAQWATLSIAIIRFVFAVPLSYLIERVGRRPLMILTSWITLVCFILMLVGSVFYHILYSAWGPSTHLTSGPWTVYVGLTAEIVWAISYNLGIGPIPRFIVAEIFPQRYRAYAQKISVQWDCGVSFIFTFLYLPVFNKIGGWVYLIVILPLAPLCVFMTVKMPETRNKDISTIIDEIYFGVHEEGCKESVAGGPPSPTSDEELKPHPIPIFTTKARRSQGMSC